MPAVFRIILLIIFLGGNPIGTSAQNPSFPEKITPRMRVIVDNDFSGDPDGLFQLAHLLLSPAADTRAIIGSHLGVNDFLDSSHQQAANAVKKANELIAVMGLSNPPPVLRGSETAMPDDQTPVKSEGVDFIIKEALRTDTKLPLYVVCGAGLTEIASALLSHPEIADKLTLVWIGGPEYGGLAYPPPRGSKIEYNLNIDMAAARAVFNRTEVKIWQVPRNAYRQPLISFAELVLHVKSSGKTGEWLYQELINVMKKLGRVGETYILGDSPLVLLTALQSYFEPDPSSSEYLLRDSPLINSSGQYEINPSGRKIRVYSRLDTGLMFRDFYAKLALSGK